MCGKEKAGSDRKHTVHASRSREPRVAGEGSARAARSALQPKRRCLARGMWPNKYLKVTTPPAIPSSPACQKAPRVQGMPFVVIVPSIVLFKGSSISFTFTKLQRALLTDRLSIDCSSRRLCHKMLTVHDFTPLTTASWSEASTSCNQPRRLPWKSNDEY